MRKANKTKFAVEYFTKFRVKILFISELKQPIIRILYIYWLNAVAKYWYLKMEEKEKS